MESPEAVSPDALIEPFLRRLHTSGRLRVWSIVVSIFGELVQARDESISVQELLALTKHVGIEESALRTALSRLAKEGWVESHKKGRLAFYALSPAGRETFLAASARIYSASFESRSTRWHLAYFKDSASKESIDASLAFSLSRRWLLMNEENTNDPVLKNAVIFATEPKQMPAWAIENLLPDSLHIRYNELLEDLQPLLASASLKQNLSPLSALAARYLIIHAWRRLVLRHPLVPPRLLPTDWPGAACHQAICRLYPDLVDISERWWQFPTPDKGRILLLDRFKD